MTADAATGSTTEPSPKAKGPEAATGPGDEASPTRTESNGPRRCRTTADSHETVGAEQKSETQLELEAMEPVDEPPAMSRPSTLT